MQATVKIRFFNEREIEERTFTRKAKDKQFSPIREAIRKKKISNNTLTLSIKTRNPEDHFAKLKSGGNFDFWDHDPGGYLLSVRFTLPDQDLMEQIPRILRRVRKFHILPGNLTLSCYVAKLGPTYTEAEEILRRSCDAIKTELEPISEIHVSYDLSIAADQEPQFYSKREFLQEKPKVEPEPPSEPVKGPIDIERRPFDPEYAAKHGSIESEDTEAEDHREEEADRRRNYKEPEYPQYSKDFYKKLEKRRYPSERKSKTGYAILIALGIVVIIGAVYGINSGLFVIPNNFLTPTGNQNSSQNTQPSNNQNSEGSTSVVANVPSTTMSGCTMASNGLGQVRINCPNYDTVSCNANPPLPSGIQSKVDLTVKQNQCQIQYLDPQGTTIIRSLALASHITPNVNNNVQPSQNIGSIGINTTPPPQTANTQQTTNTQQTSTTNTPPDIYELRNYALKVINQDREANGLSPVSLSNNQAAQVHANDMLKAGTLSHYMTDGEKPYMVYTKYGGSGYVAQNAAFNGYGNTQQCGNPLVICNAIDPKQSISKTEYDMIHNDASSNWGHRDNILDKHHTDVSIGIAYDKYSFYITQNFEDHYIDYRTPLSENNGIVSFSGNLKAGSISGIGIYYDPLPTSATYDEHKDDGYYKLGDQVATVQPPPQETSYYPPSTDTFEVADRWVQQGNYANIAFDISPFVTQAGVYTIVAYLQDGSDSFPVTSYSITETSPLVQANSKSPKVYYACTGTQLAQYDQLEQEANNVGQQIDAMKPQVQSIPSTVPEGQYAYDQAIISKYNNLIDQYNSLENQLANYRC